MKYNELTIKPARKPNRLGRGISAGGGKTAGRGTKGQGARKSGGVRPGFEGGQMPLYMRLPKLRGFKSKKTKAETVTTGNLEAISKTVITLQELLDSGYITSVYADVKLITKGSLKAKKDVKLPLASRGAISVIEKAGGSYSKISPPRQLKKPAAKK